MSDRLVKVFVAGVAVALVVVAVLVGPRFVGGAGAAAPKVQLATAAVRSFPVAVQASGTVLPRDETAVNPAGGGRVSRIDVSVGQQVGAGDVLAHLDAAAATSAVAEAQAGVSSAQAALSATQSPLDPATAARLQGAITAAQANLSQVQAAVQATATEDAGAVANDQQQVSAATAQYEQDGCVSQPSPDPARCSADQAALTSAQQRLGTDQARASADAGTGASQIAAAQSQVAQSRAALAAASLPSPSAVSSAQAGLAAAQARLQSAQATLANLTVTAPEPGTVLQINGQAGQTVSSGGTTVPLPGTTTPVPPAAGSTQTAPFILLGTPTDLLAAVTVPTDTVQQVAVGQHGTLTASVPGGLSVPCHVLGVAQAPTTVGGSQAFYVTVVPDGPTPRLVAGAAAAVSLDVGQVSDALAVPQSAVYQLAGVPHVDVWDGRRAHPTVVGTGGQGTTLVQITSGLEAGQQVVLSAYQGLPGTATSPPTP